MSELTTPTKSSGPATEGSPIVSRKVGAGIQARLAKLQGATGAPVVNREVPKKFANGYDEPFRERLDGTLRRSLSGTWSVNALEAENSSASVSTDGSQTLVEVQHTGSLPTVSEEAELKRRRDFTQRWEKQQEAVVEQLLTPEPSRIQSSPQPIIEEPEPEPEEQTADSQPAPATPIQAPPPADPKHGILTPPISEPESTPVRKTASKSTVRPHTTGPVTRVRTRPAPQAPSPTPTATTATAPKTPTRSRPRASAPSLAPPPVPRLHLTPSPSRATPRAPSVPPRSQTSLSTRRVSAPASSRPRLSSKIPDKVLPPPVRTRTISKVYEGPTLSSLAKQKPPVSPGMASRAVSRADFTS